MSSLLDSIVSIPTPFNMIVLVVLIGSAAGVISAIAKEVRKYLCHRAETELKREMLNRGMKSHEIERVMHAKMVDVK
jgi:hypothetical protein